MYSKIKNTLFGTNNIPLVLRIQRHYFFRHFDQFTKAREIGARPDEIDRRQLYTF